MMPDLSAHTSSRLAARLILRAGWAPLAVFLVHGTLAGWVIDIYASYPRLDIPMHLLGGFAIAYFLSSCVAAVSGDVVASMTRPRAEVVVVMSLTAAIAVCWEVGELLSDEVFGTHLQPGLGDATRDFAFGMLGAAVFVLVRRSRGRLGAPAPLDLPNSLAGRGAGRTSSSD